MKIALINENSQAAKNELIAASLKKVVEPMGHTVYNYGMYTADDAAQLTYVQVGKMCIRDSWFTARICVLLAERSVFMWIPLTFRL